MGDDHLPRPCSSPRSWDTDTRSLAPAARDPAIVTYGDPTPDATTLAA
jgi:hypothetical protein